MLTVPNEWKDALVNDALQAAQDQTPTSAPCCHFAVQQASQRQAANAACRLLLPLKLWSSGGTQKS